jgi:hypothetical protein
MPVMARYLCYSVNGVCYVHVLPKNRRINPFFAGGGGAGCGGSGVPVCSDSAAEQIYKAAKSWPEKKAYALKYLSENGITYNEDTVNAAIEPEVKKLNISQGK